MRIILPKKFVKISDPLLNVKGKIKNSDKNHSISQKNFVFQSNEKGKNFERKKNTIRIEISFPEKPRMVFFFSSRNVV